MPFIDLKQQYASMKESIDQRVHAVLDLGRFFNGPEVAELEEQLARYVGVTHAITCANGTDALQLSLMALGVGVGDVVLCPTFTFFATAEAIALVGATPVFVDSNANTFNMCSTDLAAKVEAHQRAAKAIIAVDLFGLPADYPAIQVIAERYGLHLIEDAAQGFGGSIHDQRAGSFGDIATTSFFPAKPLGCYGDGGALFTDDDELAQRLRSLVVHGKGEHKYDNVRIGMNSRLDTIQAAILLEKLAAFPAELARRHAAAERYSSGLSRIVDAPTVPDGYASSWAQYTIKDTRRDAIMKQLAERGIPSMIYYQQCIHRQSAFAHNADDSLPIAEQLSSEVFSLPMSGYVPDETIDTVVSALTEIMA
ncbi:MAG: DegT/DnrJ/EryC1/StrS family aminotransferase [Pseudomonadota bacterium]